MLVGSGLAVLPVITGSGDVGADDDSNIVAVGISESGGWGNLFSDILRSQVSASSGLRGGASDRHRHTVGVVVDVFGCWCIAVPGAGNLAAASAAATGSGASGSFGTGVLASTAVLTATGCRGRWVRAQPYHRVPCFKLPVSSSAGGPLLSSACDAMAAGLSGSVSVATCLGSGGAVRLRRCWHRHHRQRCVDCRRSAAVAAKRSRRQSAGLE